MARIVNRSDAPICACGAHQVETTKSNGAYYTRPMCSTCYRSDKWKIKGTRNSSAYEFIRADNFKRWNGKSTIGNYRCENPFCNVYVKVVEVHHLDGDNTNNVRENLICLCADCHGLESTLHNDRMSTSNPNRRVDYRNWIASGKNGAIQFIFKPATVTLIQDVDYDIL